MRWFTPLVEIHLCGHATLASAHILCQQQIRKANDPVAFATKSGVIAVPREGDWIEMDFPGSESTPATVPHDLLQIPGIHPVATGEVFDRYWLEVATEDEITGISPDFAKLKNYRKVLITSRAKTGSPFDFIPRYFAPSIGVDEDPVTGTSHSRLAPYGSKKLDKSEFLGCQASKRTGILRLKLTDEV